MAAAPDEDDGIHSIKLARWLAPPLDPIQIAVIQVIEGLSLAAAW